MVTQRTETENVAREMSYEQFLTWADEDTHAEWVKGEVVELMPPTERHQELIGWLVTLLSLFVDQKRTGKVLPAPFEMKLDVVPSSRQPDVIVTLAMNSGRMDGMRLHGAADLAIEIISDDSVTRDRRDKYGEYAVGGVSEYWIIDPRVGRYSFQAFRLAEEGYFEAIPLNKAGRVPSIVIPGLAFDPAWISMQPLPKVLKLFLSMVPDAAVALDD